MSGLYALPKITDAGPDLEKKSAEDIERLLRVPRPLPSSAVSSWDVSTIRSALNRHDEGDFAASTLLVFGMLRDAAIATARLQRVNTVIGLTLESKAADESAKAEAIATEAKAAHEKAAPPEFEAWALTFGVMLGVAIAAQEWFVLPGKRGAPTRWARILHPWPMGTVWKDLQDDCYHTTTLDGPETIHKGDPRWFVYEPNGSDSHLYSAVRPLGLVWADRTFAIRDRAQASEALGMANVIGSLPEGMAPDSPEARAFSVTMRGLQQHKSGMVKPHGFGVERIGAFGDGPIGLFKEIIDSDSEDAAKILLGQSGTTMNQGGSLAKTVVLDGVRYDLVEADVRTYSSAMHVQSNVPWTILNWGDASLAANVSRVVPDMDEDLRLGAIAARHKAFAEVVKEHQALGIESDVEALAKQFGVSIPGFKMRPPAPTAGRT